MLTNIGNLLSKVGMFVKPDVGICFPTLEYLMLTNIGNLLSKVGMFVKPDVGIRFLMLEWWMDTNVGNLFSNVGDRLWYSNIGKYNRLPTLENHCYQ